MDVTLVGQYFDEARGEGIERYAWNLKKTLEEKGVGVKTIKCSESLDYRFMANFNENIDLPFKVLSKKPESIIYHFVMQYLGIGTVIAKKVHKRKVVTTIHDFQHRLFRTLRYSLLEKSIQMSISASDMLITDSSLIKQDIIQQYGIDQERIRVCNLGVDPKFKPVIKEKKERFTVGYVGGFAPGKDVKSLIRAYSIFEKNNTEVKPQLVLYGKGKQYNECMALAKELDLKNAEFRGFAPEKNLVGIYNSFDVFVFPTLAEGFGLPILEASKCGVPVIVKQDAHISEEVTRYCMKATDDENLAELLKQVADKGFTYTQEHKKHLEQFTWENCADSTIKAYKELI